MTLMERIKKLRTTRGLTMLVVLTAAWCGLWQEISVANIAAGFLLAVAVLASGVGTPTIGAIKFRPLINLLWIVLIDLVTSTAEVAREVITPTDNTNEAIMAVDITTEGRHHLLLLTIAVTLTPGTAVIDADSDTGTLYLHLLHAERSDAVAEHVRELATLACLALPLPPAQPRLQTTS